MRRREEWNDVDRYVVDGYLALHDDGDGEFSDSFLVILDRIWG